MTNEVHPIHKINDAANEPAFAPFVETCQRHGISRMAAYRLADKGLIETFCLGRRRYVVMESLRSLPERIAQKVAA